MSAMTLSQATVRTRLMWALGSRIIANHMAAQVCKVFRGGFNYNIVSFVSTLIYCIYHLVLKEVKLPVNLTFLSCTAFFAMKGRRCPWTKLPCPYAHPFQITLNYIFDLPSVMTIKWSIYKPLFFSLRCACYRNYWKSQNYFSARKRSFCDRNPRWIKTVYTCPHAQNSEKNVMYSFIEIVRNKVILKMTPISDPRGLRSSNSILFARKKVLSFFPTPTRRTDNRLVWSDAKLRSIEQTETWCTVRDDKR